MALFETLRDVLTPYAEKINDLPLYKPLAFSKRPTIPDNTDIDTMLTPGEYKITTSTHAKTMTNLPSTMSGILTVFTAVSSTTYIQVYRAVSTTGYMYTRTKSGTASEWSEWRRIALNDELNVVPRNDASEYTAINSGTDLNTILTPGDYKITNSSVASSLINSPFSGSGFNLRVFQLTAASTTCQLAIGANTNLNIYLRINSNGVFSEWKKIAMDVDSDGIASSINSIGSAVNNNSSRISTIEDSLEINNSYVTPYYDEEQAFYDKVNNDIDKNTLVFLISADNHYRETKPEGEHQVYYAEVMAKIAKRLRVDAIINLGDIITQYIDSIDDPVYSGTGITAEEVNTMRLAKMATAFQSTGVPFLYTIAHHEMGLHTNASVTVDKQTQTNTYPYPESKVLGICGKGSEWIEEHHYSQDPLSSGYYVDFPRHKVRLISIDSVSYTLTGFSPESIAFIGEAFSNVPNGYKVIVLSHVASRYPGVYSSQVDNGDQVEAIMQNYVSGGGTILAYIHGHSHFDNIVKIDGVPYPYVCICCAENSWSTVGEKIDAGVLGNPVSYKDHSATRGAAIGTYNEYLFDVACIHPDVNTIRLFRFGIGTDRTVTLD